MEKKKKKKKNPRESR